MPHQDRLAQAIVDDYVLSETVLKESRMHDELHLDVYLTSDDVIAATRDTMEETIAFINTKYGGVRDYLSDVRPSFAQFYSLSGTQDGLPVLDFTSWSARGFSEGGLG